VSSLGGAGGYAAETSINAGLDSPSAPPIEFAASMRRTARVQALPLLDQATLLVLGSLGLLVVVLLLIVPLVGAT